MTRAESIGLFGRHEAVGGRLVIFAHEVYLPASSGPMRTTAWLLPAITFSTLRSWLSNSSGVGSWFLTVSSTTLPAGTLKSAGVKT